MKKYLCIILVLLSLLVLGSCNIGGNDSGGTGGGSGGHTPGGENTPMTVSIVVAEWISPEDLTDLRDAVALATGLEVAVTDDSTEQTGFEIVIGDTTRQISARAYRVLSRVDGDDPDGNKSYVIYSYDGSVAIAYDEAYSLNMAMEYFKENCLRDLLKYGDGTVASSSVPLMSYLDEKREESRKEAFAAVADELGEETAKAIEDLYNLYNADMYIWLANLWDPDTGGFYYSASGRDTIGYLPDLESTRQALNYIQNSGLIDAYDGGLKEALSEQTVQSIVSWVQGLQSSTDGYFYHPQWGRNIKDSRRGRDLKWATAILKQFGAKPYYDAPDGTKGSLGAAGMTSYRLTDGLGASASVAVSKVVMTAGTSGLPDYLKDTGKWLEYIENLNIRANSYSAGNTLSAMSTQIKNAGEEYVQIVIDYLYEHQNAENGLWEDEVGYQAVNGLMKISELIIGLGHYVNNIDAALDSVIRVALLPDMTPEGNEHVCSVYNPWVAMNSLLECAENVGGDSYVDSIRSQIIDKAPELIRATKDKISIFKKLDGGFSYYADFCAPNSQGASVALPQSAESDVNATTISSRGIPSNICAALGIEWIELFTEEDGEYFLSLFNSLGTIIKDPEPDFDGPTERVATFTEGAYDTLYVRNYFGTSSNTSVSVSEYTDAIESGFDPITNFDVVKDPLDSSNNVLRVIAEKSKEYVLGYTAASVSNANAIGNCYSIEFRMYYTDILEKGDVMQIHFNTGADTAMSLRLLADQTRSNLSVVEYNNTGSGSNTVDGVSIPTDEWVTLRIEFYQTGSADTTMAKLYLGTDGKDPVCVADVNAYRAVALEGNGITTVQLAHQRTNGSTVYLDDIALTKTEKEFVPMPLVIRDKVATFENGDSELDYVTNTMVNGDITVISIDKDPENSDNNVLKVVGRSGGTSGTQTSVAVSNAKDAGTTYTLEARLYFTGLSKTLCEDVIQIYLNGSSSAMGFAFKGTSDAKAVSLLARNNVTGGTGNREIKGFDGNTVSFAVDTWYTFRLEYYATGSADTTMTKIYVAEGDGELECVAEANIYRDASITRITSARMAWQKWNTEYTVYADDISLLVSEAAFVSEESKLPDDSEYSPTAEVMSAKGGATGIITLMHDDGYMESAIAMDKLLLKHGLVGDVAMIASHVTSDEVVKQWQALLDTNRWKIASHSMTHTWWGIEPEDGDYTKLTDDTEKAISEFIESQAFLREKFPSQRVLTFVWPGFSEIYNNYVDADKGITKEMVLSYMNSEYVKELVDRYYIAGRNGSGYVELDGDGTEWNHMPGTHISKGNINEILSLIDDAASEGYLCVLYTHKIIEAEEGTEVTGTGTYIASYYMDDVYEKVASKVAEGSIWNTYYEDAVLYVREYRSSSVEVSGDASGVSVALTDALDDTIYNYPLTVKINAPSSWEAVRIVQGDRILYTKVIKSGLKRYILADIVPDGGVAAITPCALSEVPEDEQPVVIPTPSFAATSSDFSPTEDVILDAATGDVISPDMRVTNTVASTDLNDAGDGYKYISFSLDTDPVSAVNSVLKIQVTAGGSKSSKTDLALQTVDYSGVCYVFEGDLYYGNSFTSDGNVTEIAFKNLSSNKYIYSIYLASATDSDGNTSLSIKDNNKTYGIGSEQTLVEGIATEKWFTLKVELWRTKSADTTVAKIYIDGVCVAEDRSYRNNALYNWGLDSVGISHISNNSHTLLLDNVIFSQISKTYVKTDFPEDGTEDDKDDGAAVSGAEGFDSGNVSSGNVSTDSKSPNTAVTVDVDPTDPTNKALKVVQENSTSSSNSTTVVALSNPDAAGSCYTFEGRFYFTGFDASTGAQDIIQMYFTGASVSDAAVGFGFKENSGADKVYFSARNKVTGGTGNESILDFDGSGVYIMAGRWYTLRYELYATGDPETTVTKLYIGEGDAEPVSCAEFYGYRSVDITDIRNFRIVWQKYATEYTVYLDDVSLTRSDKTFVSEAE